MYTTYDALCELSDECIALADRLTWRLHVLRLMVRAVIGCSSWRSRYHAARLCIDLTRLTQAELELLIRLAERHVND